MWPWGEISYLQKQLARRQEYIMKGKEKGSLVLVSKPDSIISLQNHHRSFQHLFSLEAILICHHSTVIAEMWPLKSMTFQQTGQSRPGEQMTDLHPDYRRSRHPYVTTWGSALTNRLTYVCLVTVINLGTRHWLVFVWWVNTGFPLAKVITVTVVWEGGCDCLSLIWNQLSLIWDPQREWKLKKSSEIRIWLVFPNTPTHTPPLISLLVISLWLWPCQ